MKRLLSLILALWALFSVVTVNSVFAQRFEFPPPEGYVNDFANVLTNDEELEQQLYDFEQAESTQILVITMDDLPDDVVLEEFVPYLTDDYPEWRAGQEEYDNGVMFLIVMNTREMRIHTGYGVEGALPDVTAKMILDNEVKPLFKDGDYNGGVQAGVDSIMDAVKGEYTPVYGGTTSESGGGGLGWFFICAPLFLFIGLPYLGAYLGRTKSWWLGGVIGFVGGLVIAGVIASIGSLGLARLGGFLVCPPVSLVLGLLFDFILSKNYKVRKNKGLSTNWGRSLGGFSPGIGGWSGGGGFSGGSSGGFSAGGGSFGGGGASSSW